MKVNKLFHWLYFIVMMLPIMVAPIFAIYSHRHQINDYSVVRDEPLTVNAYQYVPNGKPYNLDGYSFTHDDGHSVVDNALVVEYFDDGTFKIDFSVSDFYSESTYQWYYSFTAKVVNSYNDNIYTSDHFSSYFSFFDNEFDDGFTCSDVYFTNYGVGTTASGDIFGSCFFSFDSDYGDGIHWYLYLKDIQLFNLTAIFGSGNEPSAETFKSYLTQDYYDYGNNVLNVGTHYVTFQDSDIGSQFVYDLYNCVDKYFNYDKVFNFADLYGWLQLTFFGGNAPLGFFIFWHLLIYWLLTSLLWLLFDVLMYVPQLIHRWLDKASLS